MHIFSRIIKRNSEKNNNKPSISYKLNDRLFSFCLVVNQLVNLLYLDFWFFNSMAYKIWEGWYISRFDSFHASHKLTRNNIYDNREKG